MYELMKRNEIEYDVESGGVDWKGPVTGESGKTQFIVVLITVAVVAYNLLTYVYRG
jgi:hypothetical protein